jgi:hypothetical protein
MTRLFTGAGALSLILLFSIKAFAQDDSGPPLPPVHGVTAPDPEWAARCAAELTRRAEIAARDEQALAQTAKEGPGALRQARREQQIHEQYRRLREEICLDPRD